MKKPRIILASLIIANPLLAGPASPQQKTTSTSPANSIGDALKVLETSKDENEKGRIYAGFQQIPIRNHDDLMALYKEAKRRQDSAPVFATEKALNEYVSEGKIVAGRLRAATDPMFQDDIAALIEREANDLPKSEDAPITPLEKMTLSAGAKSAVRLARINALIESAGDGKNEKARTALWHLIDIGQDSYIGRQSAEALGKIGKSEDLDRLIRLIERNPQLRIAFGSNFGSMVVPRVMREIEDPNVADSVKPRFILGLQEAASHETLPLYFPLLEHPNKSVAHMAATVVSINLSVGDEVQISRMLQSPSARLRAIALSAVDGNAWNEKFVPLLIQTLKNDPEKDNRITAAYSLGHHRVQSAIPALQAALNDSAPSVRKESKHALSTMH